MGEGGVWGLEEASESSVSPELEWEGTGSSGRLVSDNAVQ